MVLAVAKAAEAGATADRLRLDRQHLGIRRGVWRGGRDGGDRRPAQGPDRGRQAAPGAHRRGAGRRHRWQLRPGARDRAGPRRTGRPPGDPGQLGQPVPPRGPEDRGFRDLRRPRSRSRRARHPGRQRGQHQRLLGRFPRLRERRAHRRARRGCGASRPPAPRRSCSAIGSTSRTRSPRRSGSATPASWDKAVAARDDSGGRIIGRDRRPDPRRLPCARPARGRVLRARVRRQRRRAHARPPPPASSTPTPPSSAS